MKRSTQCTICGLHLSSKGFLNKHYRTRHKESQGDWKELACIWQSGYAYCRPLGKSLYIQHYLLMIPIQLDFCKGCTDCSFVQPLYCQGQCNDIKTKKGYSTNVKYCANCGFIKCSVVFCTCCKARVRSRSKSNRRQDLKYIEWF